MKWLPSPSPILPIRKSMSWLLSISRMAARSRAALLVLGCRERSKSASDEPVRAKRMVSGFPPIRQAVNYCHYTGSNTMNTKSNVKRGRGKSPKAAQARVDFLKVAVAHFGAKAKFKNPEYLAFARTQKQFNKASWNWIFTPKYRAERGMYQLPDVAEFAKENTVPAKTEAKKPVKSAVQKPAAKKAKTEALPKIDVPVLSDADEKMANKILMRLARR